MASRLASALLCALLIASCGAESDDEPIILRNSNGMEVHLLRTGACVQRLLVPDSAGDTVDVMMGFDDAESYRNGTSVSGCIIGRYGGRITGGKFSLDGKDYQLETGKDGNTLHGGGIGYSKREWELAAVSPGTANGTNDSWAVLTLDSPDGDQNFPGNVSLEVTYTLTDANELIIDISAVSDAATPINVFNHPYFNLAGLTSDNATILDHVLTINSDYFIATDPETGTPTELEPVAGSPEDFTDAHAIGERIGEFANTIKGYQTQYLLFGTDKASEDFFGAEPAQLAATLVHPASGRALDILTTAPTMVLYTANSLKGKFETKGGVRPQQYAAVALEATMLPDAGNEPAFPAPVLRPGQEYRNHVVWRFYDV
ncbi:hypothetical protein ABPG75_006481 [Micractinium tetrahymenae]